MYFIKEANYSDWSGYFKKCHKANILQCWQYGNAKEQTSRWNAVRFLILNEKGCVVGLVQALMIKIPIIGGIVRVNRGPILVKNFPSHEIETETLNMISALLDEFQNRRWWLVQIAPEIKESELEASYLKRLGLNRLASPFYSSGLLNLLVEEQTLLSSLKKKWRYYLKKGNKIGFKIEILKGNCDQVEVLLKKYKQLQEDKEFSGLSSELISALAKESGDEWQFTLFVAKENDSYGGGDPLGMLVSIRHGDTSTYLIGLTNKKGREFQVNYVLLWEAILNAKNEGCAWFDLGGMDSTTPKGIAHFKAGLNSETYDLSGEWRGILYPWKTFHQI